MPIDLTVLGRRTVTAKTVLFFGAGSSIPSGGPSAKKLTAKLAEKFGIQMSTPLDLPSLATIIEVRYDRRALVEVISKVLEPLSPTRGILNLPDFDWAGLYTTNYDRVIEKSYSLQKKTLHVISSNFDFGRQRDITEPRLFKLHGTINQDVSFGHQNRMIISTSDFDGSNDYRKALYTRFTEQLITNDAIIIGHSLADSDLQGIVDTAIREKREKGAPGKITLIVYEKDENLGLVNEARGLDVCFAGVDEFFAELTKERNSEQSILGVTNDPLDKARNVLPSTLSISSIRDNQTEDLSRMFNGSPASYADIMRGWTFARDFADRLESQFADENGKRIAYVLGPAGSGKTTGARKALIQLVNRGIECWEHIRDFPLLVNSWKLIDNELRERGQTGVLLIDDAHNHLLAVNMLLDAICSKDKPALKVLLVSSRPHWNPRLKSPAIFTEGEAQELGALSSREIDSLLDILESSTDIATLVERRFLGFNRTERRRRLARRCRSDMFVCMKNIFGSETFDDIILQEYAELSPDYQEVYKQIAGMEAAGVRVHRQLVIRTVGIHALQVARYLEDLEGIIEERTVNESEGIFAWQVRHGVIADIIAKYKFLDEAEQFALLERTIDNLNPSYHIEIISINEICDPQKGLAQIYNKEKQNVLLRKLISLAPRQRVPRHRLITNLISLGNYESANTEIRLFENELRIDGPVQRYKVRLLIERANQTTGLLQEDRVAMIREAASIAEAGIDRFPDDKNLYRAFLEVGVAYLKFTDDRDMFDFAMQKAQSAYERILDPDLARTIHRFGQQYANKELAS